MEAGSKPPILIDDGLDVFGVNIRAHHADGRVAAPEDPEKRKAYRMHPGQGSPRPGGMRVVAWNRSGVDPALPCEELALDEVLASADAVSVHLALTPETRGFFDAARIRGLKRGVLLVNVARGALFDETALLAALRDGHVGHAALDVFATEPLPANHPFAALQNVTLSAHAAWKSRAASQRLLAEGLALARADAERLTLGQILAA